MSQSGPWAQNLYRLQCVNGPYKSCKGLDILPGTVSKVHDLEFKTGKLDNNLFGFVSDQAATRNSDTLTAYSK
jgi:hypothetical protein